MPLQEGKSKKVIGQNFHEFRHGKTFRKTEAKSGKAAAEEQMIAVVLSKAKVQRKGKR